MTDTNPVKIIIEIPHDQHLRLWNALNRLKANTVNPANLHHAATVCYITLTDLADTLTSAQLTTTMRHTNP